ncbi:MAG: HD domain-containing protein [Methanoregula sp.]
MILRDAIHGDLYFNDLENKIIDTNEMQRLRGLKQLGTASLVYPTAVHTRFDHSLGVNGVTKKILQELKNKPNSKKIIDKCDLRLIEVSSLIHDITHIPFGHTFEDEMLIFDRHDKKDRYIDMIQKTDLGQNLENLKIFDDVIKIISTKEPENDLDNPWQAQIISNTICSDILDYLRRDSYFCGLKKNYDDRIFKYFDIKEKDGKNIIVLDLLKGNALRDDALTEIIHILRLRFFLAQRVYLHHTKVCAGAMLSKALSIAKEFNIEKKQLYPLTDETFMQFLLKFPKKHPDEKISSLVSHVLKRDLLKRAYILSPRTLSHIAKQTEFISKYHLPNDAREKMEQEIAHETKTNSDNIIIYCTGQEALKEADVYVNTWDNEIKKLSELPHQTELDGISQAYQNLWKFYVFAPREKVTEVHDICTGIFGEKSEYVPKQYKKGLDRWIKS